MNNRGFSLNFLISFDGINRKKEKKSILGVTKPENFNQSTYMDYMN